VALYRFAGDGSGEVVAEARQANVLPSLQGYCFPRESIPTRAREAYLRHGQQVIIDLDSERKTLARWQIQPGGSEQRYEWVDPCHIRYLRAMGVRASLTVPVIHQEALWGLLAVHHSQQRHFTQAELQATQLQVGELLVALAAADCDAQAQWRQREADTLRQIEELLQAHADGPLPGQALLATCTRGLDVDGARLYLDLQASGQGTQLHEVGLQPEGMPATELPAWEGALECEALDGESQPAGMALPYWVLDAERLSQLPQLKPLLDGTPIESAATIALQSRRQRVGYLSLFRTARTQTVDWIGWSDPQGEQGRAPGQLQSWQEQHRAAPAWTPNTIALLQSVAQSLHTDIVHHQIQVMSAQAAAYDALTELPNWELMQKRLAWAVQRARQSGAVMAVAVVDLSRFRSFNASFGHATCDGFLHQIAQRLRDFSQQRAQAKQPVGPAVGRWHGDRFLGLFPCANSLEAAHQLGQELTDLFRSPLSPPEGGEQAVYLSASVGIALILYDGDSTDGVLQNAEAAQQEAKQCGDNAYRLYADITGEAEISDPYLESELRQAIGREELRLRYQPQLDAATGQTVGVEALVRWQHPRWGQVSPGKFIPLAEQTGLIHAIDDWVLQQACRQQMRWAQQGWPLRMSVNLSALQLQDPNLASRVAQILQDTGIEASCLELEITEKTAIENRKHTRANLRALQQLGVRIALDDFGQGYSALGVLRYLPIDTLKVDHVFVEAALQSREDAAVVRTIIELGHDLGLNVLAEGIETGEQRDLLYRLWCDCLQGYLFSAPQTAEALWQQGASATSNIPNNGVATDARPAKGNTGGDSGPSQDQAAEYERLNRELRQQLRREQLVNQVAQKIRDSLDLEEVLNVTVTEVRTLLQTDRVLLYRLAPDRSGEIVQESVLPDCQSLKGDWLSDSCFPETYVEQYRQGRVRAIEDIEQAGLSDCHRRMLADRGVRADLIVPVVYREHLWGLLVAHHCRGPRQWRQHEIALLSELATHTGIAIYQSELYRQLETANQQLRELAGRDALTQLANRASFDRYLRQEWDRLQRSQAPLSVILCDLDRFKALNDTWGHPAGDAALQQVAQALQGSVGRAADLVARYGGDEFALVLPETTLEGAQQVAERACQAIRTRALDYQGSRLPDLALSAGTVTVIPNQDDTPDNAVAFADRALYRAKAAGGDGVTASYRPQC